MRILKEKNRSKNYVYRDQVNGRIYQRIVGGIALPSDKPGHVVVMGEEATIRPPYHIYFICESSEDTINKLFSKALEFQTDCWGDGFYGRISDQAKQYLVNFNRSQNERQLKTLELYSAPNSSTGNIGYHVGLLVDALSATQKTLFLENSLHLPKALKQMSLQDASGATDSEYPIVASLGYAVSLLIENPPIPDFLRNRKSKTNYDILSYEP
jgi:hypothetical protein